MQVNATANLCVLPYSQGAVVAGNNGFLAIGDWINDKRGELIDLLKPKKDRLPSYSTIRRVLLKLDYER